MHGNQVIKRPAGYPWRQPSGWWMKNNHYMMYMIRELTAVFAALWVVFFLVQIARNGRNVSAWVATLTNPGWLVFSIVAFIFVLYHAWTAFTATGTLMYVRMSKQPIPPGTINGSMFVAWAGASIVIAIILLTNIISG